jgi:hypothetical protein
LWNRNVTKHSDHIGHFEPTLCLETWMFLIFIRPTLHALNCENNTYKVRYMFRHFLTAIIRHSPYQLKLCPSTWSVMWAVVTTNTKTVLVSDCASQL